MDGTKYVEVAVRDSAVISAMRNALEAMRLTHGAKITMCGVTGTLNYEREMLAIRAALTLLCVDPDEPTSPFETGADST